MKKLTLSLALVFAGTALAAAQEAPSATRPAETKPAEAKSLPSKVTTHKVEAEVVSADLEKKTLTMKVEGAEKTAPVGPLAVYRLKKVKAGDKVVLTCRDNEAGEHVEIAFIKPVEAPAPAAPAEKKN
jgi:hypothetical protein